MNRTSCLVVVLAIVFAANVVSYVYLANLAAKNPEAPAYPFVAGDSVTYAALADSLIEHGGFTGSGF
ncbi:MAG: hypothetical protein RLZZ416_542, partial [Candidatus Parcubacteria bacterium]